MLGESVFSSNLWLNPKSGKCLGIDISLIMFDCFFVIFQQTIGMDILVPMSGYLFLPLLLYSRCLGDFKPLLLLGSVVILYSGLHTLLNFLFSRRDFLLLPFFFNINLCGPTLLGFFVGRRTTSVKTTLSTRSVFKSTWLKVWQSGKLILKWLIFLILLTDHRCPWLVPRKVKGTISILYIHIL